MTFLFSSRHSLCFSFHAIRYTSFVIHVFLCLSSFSSSGYIRVGYYRHTIVHYISPSCFTPSLSHSLWVHRLLQREEVLRIEMRSVGRLLSGFCSLSSREKPQKLKKNTTRLIVEDGRAVFYSPLCSSTNIMTNRFVLTSYSFFSDLSNPKSSSSIFTGSGHHSACPIPFSTSQKQVGQIFFIRLRYTSLWSFYLLLSRFGILFP